MDKNKILVLLDAHAIIHRAYHALPQEMSINGEPTGALYGLVSMLIKIISDLKPDYLIACYDLPQKTFRHEAYEGYKMGRAKAEEALVNQLKKSRDVFQALNIPIYDMPGFEADDIIGTITKKLENQKNINIIIASGDMDTLQLVVGKSVQVYTLKHGIKDIALYDEDAVIKRFGFKPNLLPDYKGLRGDPSDNIIGVKGIGEKIACNLIINFGSIEEIYKKLSKSKDIFFKVGISERVIKLLEENKEEAEFSKVLATIRKDAPIDFQLPKKTFIENLETESVENMLAEFGFRSLAGRWRGLIRDNLGNNTQSNNIQSNNINPNNINIEINPRELKETAIALWLINSDLINPTMEDILSFAGKINISDFEYAREKIFQELKEKKLDKVYEEIEKPIIPLVEKMEERGILIDKKFFENLHKDYNQKLRELTKRIYKIAGEEFNINSPKQLSRILFEKLRVKSLKRRNASGNLSTRSEILEELIEENPIIEQILAYKELQKLISTYIDIIIKRTEKDERLHAKFTQNGTTTGRFSSQDPNLQNLPIKTELGKKIRYGFIAQEGHELCSFDYSQIELRVSAILSGDPKMTKIFTEKKDIHSGVASLIFNVPIENVDYEMRRRAKIINFGILYGMGISSLQKSLASTRKEAQIFHDNYFKQFSALGDYLNNVKKFAEKNGYTETLFGRRRNFANINSKIPFLKNLADRMAINAPIQGTATADIIKLAIRYANEDLEKAKLNNNVHLVLQIHDELVYEIHNSVLEKAMEIIKNAMENVLQRSYLKYKTEIVLEVHAKCGNNLGELK